MKEPRDKIEEAGRMSGGDSLSLGSHKENISMPICFLVKEQAKSSVAIQEIQKRLDIVENVQEDVIDAIIQFRDYLSNNSKSLLSPGSLKDSPATFKPSNSDSGSSEADVKKDSVVSDKQDSGLESAGHLSITKNALKPESNDELIQLLDEIACRSGVLLQRQLSAVEESNPDLSDAKTIVDEPCSTKELSSSPQDRLGNCSQDFLSSPQNRLNGCPQDHASSCPQDRLSNCNQNCLSIPQDRLNVCSQDHRMISSQDHPNTCPQDRLSNFSQDRLSSCPQDRLNGSQDRLLNASSHALDQSAFAKTESVPTSRSMADLFETKPIGFKSISKRKSSSSIDSVAVSSILKETNVTELQRLALIYLADNAVLQAKVQEAEQIASLKQLESEKLEMSLKDEGRLLMMENRELRIAVDEAKLAANSLRSRVAMLERMLYSVSQENQELNLQLGESLNLSATSGRKGLMNYNSSYAFEGASSNKVKNPRRSSLPAKLSLGDKSQRTSFLDMTMEESETELDETFAKTRQPMFASTPMLPAHKTPKSHKTNFQSAKKCFRGNHISDIKISDDTSAASDTSACAKKLTFQNSETISTILERLRNNSEYRLNRSSNGATTAAQKSEMERTKSNENLDGVKSVVVDTSSAQKRKTRNIQQRIQNILDGIVAESEEAT